MLVVQKGYGAYIAVLYIISGLVASNVSYAVIIALMLKHNKKDNYFTRCVDMVILCSTAEPVV